jgi:hypothetical protein
LTWDLPAPHVISISVSTAEIDAYDHVNNSVYMTWFDRAAWGHSGAVGLPLEQCLDLAQSSQGESIEALPLTRSPTRIRRSRRFE